MILATARQKLLDGSPPEVHVLDAAKAAKFNARTMLLPSPTQIQEAIKSIPVGQAKSLLQLRHELAKASDADVTCPWCAGVYWRVVADVAEEDRAAGSTDIAPWWRVTKDGKPNPKLPGGAERHRELLLEEGVRI
jgi:hypothetical protein